MTIPHQHHQHRAVPALRKDVGFTGPVSWPENPRAHGNITQIDFCRCGAVRRTNRNAGLAERGAWEEMTP